MASWWDRDPEALDAEIKELTDAGFRVHREVIPGARQALTVEADGETYRVVYLHRENRLAQRLVAFKPWPDPELSVAGQETAHSAVVRLRTGEGRRIFDRVAGCVYVPAVFRSRVTGAGGILRLGRSRVTGGSYALRSVIGSHASLKAPTTGLESAFPDEVSGLWVRGGIPRFEQLGPHKAVRAVEDLIADAHGIDPEVLRGAQKQEVLALLRSRYGGDDAGWTFVRRDPSGTPLLLRSEQWTTSLQPARAPYSRQLAGTSVTLIGCGAVGWTVALELVRSGLSKIVLYDDDLVRTHNLARLDTYLGAAGRFKVDVLAEQLQAIAPEVQVEIRPLEVGTHAGAAGLVADGFDLLINVTGEEISTDETNAASLIFGRPAIYAWVSNGVYSGRIIRVRPGESACYDCVREFAPYPIRTSGPAPVGAENPWTGACFDIDIFACAVARIAVLTLAGEPVSGRNPDHIVLDFEGPVPTAREVAVPRDPRCAWCS